MYFDRNDWTNELLFYLLSMVAATFAAALAMGVLSLNLKPVVEDNWRSRTCKAILALVLMDIMAADSFLFGFRVFNREVRISTSFSAA